MNIYSTSSCTSWLLIHLGQYPCHACGISNYWDLKLNYKLFYVFLFRYEQDQNVRTPPGKGSDVPAMGLGLAPMSGGGHQRTRHRSHALRRLSCVALVKFVNVPGRPAGAPNSGTRSSSSPRRCSSPRSALLRWMVYGLWSQEMIDGIFRTQLR